MVRIVAKNGGGEAAQPRSGGGANWVERLIFFLQALLVAASGIATFKGISDFFGILEHGILSPVSATAFIFAAFVVAVLTTAMWFSIEWTANRAHSIASRIAFFCLYLVLLLWSIGFGYGFWWSFLSADDQTNAEVAAWVSDLKLNIADADGQLSAFLVELDRMRLEALRLREVEEKTGGTCGPPSGGGCRALCNVRKGITDNLLSIHNTMKDGWLDKLKGDLGTFSANVNAELARLNTQPELEKRRGLTEIRQRGNDQQTNFNSFSRLRAQTLRADLEAIAKSLNIPPNQPNFKCYNPDQARSIQQVVKALEDPPSLKIRDFKIYLGADSTKVAILKLWRWVVSSLTGYELSFMQATGFESAQASATPRGNDWIALMATCLVDLSILIFALFKPRRAFSGHREAHRWLDANFGDRKQHFVDWYWQYKVDFWGSIYMIRPTQFWTCNSRNKSTELSLDQIGGIAVPLVEKKLIVEIKPRIQLLSLAQQVLHQRGWSVQTADAPATVYKVVGNGLAQLYTVAARDKSVQRRHSFFRDSRRSDRSPGG